MTLLTFCREYQLQCKLSYYILTIYKAENNNYEPHSDKNLPGASSFLACKRGERRRVRPFLGTSRGMPGWISLLGGLSWNEFSSWCGKVFRGETQACSNYSDNSRREKGKRLFWFNEGTGIETKSKQPPPSLPLPSLQVDSPSLGFTIYILHAFSAGECVPILKVQEFKNQTSRPRIPLKRAFGAWNRIETSKSFHLPVLNIRLLHTFYFHKSELLRKILWTAYGPRKLKW